VPWVQEAQSEEFVLLASKHQEEKLVDALPEVKWRVWAVPGLLSVIANEVRYGSAVCTVTGPEHAFVVFPAESTEVTLKE
jgi:hypothetical protein